MCTLVAAGTRQEISDQYRRNEPAEHKEFEHTRRAAREKIEWEQRQGGKAAEQSRHDERAVTRGHQRIVERRRMHQRLYIVSDWCKDTHWPIARPSVQTRSPFYVG